MAGFVFHKFLVAEFLICNTGKRLRTRQGRQDAKIAKEETEFSDQIRGIGPISDPKFISFFLLALLASWRPWRKPLSNGIGGLDGPVCAYRLNLKYNVYKGEAFRPCLRHRFARYSFAAAGMARSCKCANSSSIAAGVLSAVEGSGFLSLKTLSASSLSLVMASLGVPVRTPYLMRKA